MIDDVVAFLEGRTVEVRGRLRARMESASVALDFERAAELRNAIRWLEQLEQPAAVERVGGGDADALGLARDGDDAVTVLGSRRKLVGTTRVPPQLAEEPDDRVLAAHRCSGTLALRRSACPLPRSAGGRREMETLFPESGGHAPVIPASTVDLADQNARPLNS
jgi:hypothetical protein